MNYIKVEVFIPELFVIQLANELNENDLLSDGNYDYAFSTTEVTGYWRPLEDATPYDGKIGVVSKEKEIKMEFRVSSENIGEVQKIIRLTHPYESPVVNYIPLITPEE